MERINSEQLAALWTKAQLKIAGFITSLVPDFHQADDVLQNVAMVVVRKRLEYDPTRPFENWALQIAKFEALKHRRGMATERHRFDESLVEQLAASYEAMLPEMDERRRAVAACMSKIAGRAREAFRLRYALELSSEAIAAEMDTSPGAVRVILHRARTVLRRCVEQRLREEESR